MDRRIQKTKKAIYDAFSVLLSQKSYSRITIQNIIDEANIGRSTFYSHFETKDELLKEMCTDLFSHIFSSSLKTEKTHDFSLLEGNPSAMITHLLYHLKENHHNLAVILSCENNELISGYFKQYLYEFISSYLLDENNIKLRQNNPELTDIPVDFLLNHIAGSFIEMMKWWVSHDMIQSPEEMSRYFGAVIFPLL